MVRKSVSKSVKLLKDMHKAAKRLIKAGILFSIFLLAVCVAMGTVNLMYYLNPAITWMNIHLTESAVSMFTLTIGCGLMFDYHIKKRENQP